MNTEAETVLTGWLERNPSDRQAKKLLDELKGISPQLLGQLPMDTLVSIIIPHWNGIDVLSECVDSLNNTEYSNFEIIVVDNNSSDESVKWLKANHPKIKIIENDKNYGYAGGCNRGINNSKGDYIIKC